MNKVIIVLEALEKSRRNKFLRGIEKTLKIFELLIWIIPPVKKLRRTSNVFVVLNDHEISKFLGWFGIPTAELSNKEFTEDEVEDIIKKSIELSERWYQYKDINKKITFLNVNHGVVLQQDLAELFFKNIKKLKYIQCVLEDIEPTSIYVENINSFIGKIIQSVADTNEIKVFSILPELYGKVKDKIRTYLVYTRHRIASIYHKTLHLMTIKNNNGEFKILVDAPYVNFIDAIFPVIDVLLKDKNHKIYILGKKEEILKYSQDFVDFPIKIKNVDISKEVVDIKRYLAPILKDAAFHEIFEYRGINFWKAVEVDIHYLLYYRLPHLIQSLKERDIILENINPDILLVGDDRTEHVRTGILLAKNKKVPVMEIQHGIYTHIHPVVTPVSDKICVFGNYAKNVLKKAGGNENQIVVTGIPKFDSLFDKKKLKFMSKMERQYKKIVLATTDGFEDVTVAVLKKILQFISIKKDIRLVIKPHPADKMDLYSKITKKYRGVIVEASKANIDDILLDADVLITIMSSTVSINAAALDVPMIHFNAKKTSSIFNLISLEVKEPEELIPAIKDALYNKEILQRLAESRKKFIHEHAYKIDGRASERVANLMREIIKESKEK